jgi:hypothetical protein
MGLETGTYLDALVPTNPASTDGLSQADDHLRLIKSTLTNTFPNITGAVNASHTELNAIVGLTSSTDDLNVLDGITATTAMLNHTDGVTSNIQTQMDTKAPLASPTFTGTLTAPTATVTTVNVTTVDLGQWTVKETVTSVSDPNFIGPPGPGDFFTKLEFLHTSPIAGASPVAKMSIDGSGNLIVTGNVTAFGTV